MSTPPFTLRPYRDADENAAIELWRRTWAYACPDIDFSARLDWWRARWQNELVPQCKIVVAECDGALIGFVTIEPASGYLDQLVVAPEIWRAGLGARLVEAAKRLSPEFISLMVNRDNERAIHFYERCGFVFAGEDVNPVSRRPVNRMEWRPA